MLEDFMSEFNNNNDSPLIMSTTEHSIQNSARNIFSNEDINKSSEIKPKRKGVWRRVRVRPADGLEVAESQNIGSQFLNKVVLSPNKDFGERIEKLDKKEHITTSNQEGISSITSATTTTTSTTTTSASTTTETATTLINDNNAKKFNNAEIEMTTELVSDYIEDGDMSTIWPSTETPITEKSDIGTGTTEKPYDSEYTTEMNYEENTFISTTQSPSIFDEVKQKLSDLFAMSPDDDEDMELLESYKPQYTNINRLRYNSVDNDAQKTTTQKPPVVTNVPLFPKDFMGNLIYATSTSTEISHETEICYRGRCVKTDEKKNNVTV